MTRTLQAAAGTAPPTHGVAAASRYGGPGEGDRGHARRRPSGCLSPSHHSFGFSPQAPSRSGDAGRGTLMVGVAQGWPERSPPRKRPITVGRERSGVQIPPLTLAVSSDPRRHEYRTAWWRRGTF